MPRSRQSRGRSRSRYIWAPKRPRRGTYDWDAFNFALGIDAVGLALAMTPRTSSKPKPRTEPKVRKETCTRKQSPQKKPNKPDTSIFSIDDSDDEDDSMPSTSTGITESVIGKVDKFFESGGLISDDEDELVQFRDQQDHHNSEPSGSVPKANIDMNNEEVLIDDGEDPLVDINNYCKETEDLLKNANALLEKFTTSSEMEVSPTTTNKSKPDTKEKRIGECPICLESLSEKQVMSTKCGHLFCKVCLEKIAVTNKKCPNCRKAVNKKNIIPIYI